jgi:hypothetical protein
LQTSFNKGKEVQKGVVNFEPGGNPQTSHPEDSGDFQGVDGHEKK